MKPTRLVVTSIDEHGRAVHEESMVQPVTRRVDPADPQARSGNAYAMLWGTDDGQATVGPGLDHAPARLPFYAAEGGSRFVLFAAPPIGEASSDDEPAVEIDDLTQVVSDDAKGFHVTDTIDYLVVIEGEITLELDDGVEVVLVAGDCVVQRGTRHAWKNLSSATAVVAGFMIGAQRSHG